MRNCLRENRENLRDLASRWMSRDAERTHRETGGRSAGNDVKLRVMSRTFGCARVALATGNVQAALKSHRQVREWMRSAGVHALDGVKFRLGEVDRSGDCLDRRPGNPSVTGATYP